MDQRLKPDLVSQLEQRLKDKTTQANSDVAELERLRQSAQIGWVMHHLDQHDRAFELLAESYAGLKSRQPQKQEGIDMLTFTTLQRLVLLCLRHGREESLKKYEPDYVSALDAQDEFRLANWTPYLHWSARLDMQATATAFR